VYAYVLMECNMKRGSGVRSCLVAEKLNFRPRGRTWRRRFFLEDFGEYCSFCLTVESSLYKYMRIYLYSAI